MSKLNKLHLLILVLLIIGFTEGHIFASEQLELDLNQAVDLALKQNLNLQMAKLQLENAQLIDQKNRIELEEYPSRRKTLQAESDLYQANENLNETRNDVITGVVEKYFQLQQATLKIQINEKKVELNKKLFEERRLKVVGGYERPLELLQQENEYLLAFSNLEDAKQEFEQLLWDLHLLVGLERITELKLTTKMFTMIEWIITEVEAVQLAIENSAQLSMLQGKIDLTKLELQNAEVSDLPIVEIKQIKNNLKYAHLSYEQKKRELKNFVRQQYRLWYQTTESLEYYHQNLIQAQENMMMIQKQINAGLKMEKELLASEILLMQVQYNQQDVILQCYVKQLQLQKMLGLEIGVVVQ